MFSNDKEILKNDSGFIELSKKLPKLDIYQEIEHAAPLTKTSFYRIPHIVWRRFDKMELPDGLLLIGDTICRIDPFFGQGMSIAVLEALALQKLLHNGRRQKVPAAFHKKAAKIISPIWISGILLPPGKNHSVFLYSNGTRKISFFYHLKIKKSTTRLSK